MPRAVKSGASAVINYFRKTEIGLAQEILGLCKDALQERVGKSQKAKERSGKPAVTAPTPTAAAAPATKRKKKPGPKKGTARPLRQAPPAATAPAEVEPQLPMVEEYGEQEDPDLAPA